MVVTAGDETEREYIHGEIYIHEKEKWLKMG